MFKKLNPNLIIAYNETNKVFQNELSKLEVIKDTKGSLTEEEQEYYDRLKHEQAKILVSAIGHINKNVWFPKRFWKKIAKKIR